MPDSFISGGGAAGLSMADWMDAEIPEGRLLIGPTRAIPAGMRRYALGGPTCSPIWRDARVIKYLHGLDTIGRLRLRRVVQGVDFRVSDMQLIDQAMRDLAMGSLSAFLIPRAIAPLSPPPVDPPRHDQGDEDPPGQPAQWSVTDRVVATLRRCVPLLPREMQQAAKSLFTRETLYWLAGFLVVWAGGHLAGYGEAIDVILLGVGYAMVGWSVFQGLNDLGHGIALATTAKTQHDLDEAAKRTAAGLTILTINAIIALIAKVKPASGGKRPMVEEPPPPPEPVRPPPREGIPEPTAPAKAVEPSREGTRSLADLMAQRKALAKNFYEQAGWSERRIADHLKGIDFTKPVDVVTLPEGTSVVQHVLPGGKVGNYFAPPGTPASSLGINPANRVPTMFTLSQDTQVLRSTAAPVQDTWTVPGQVFDAEGGGTQYFTTNPSNFTQVGL
ncbi:polymorphic toxin type 46 domain-containing protein [Nitrospirillum amazonense]|uniref:polymorphic toxin type 46 domain-containing protein n=1 Tax=Nitrospirillum amazonense TaxID=28077 RepID=UPI002DD44BB1|nr:polymorphic toxin type 46 domain-containing protein [Nitrospirillum amazonense]MEC4594653.1 polymorphic toxin type 46 domain-containing protein [Nitrospirillum amazonense]